MDKDRGMVQTDWQMIRDMMNAAIDACERMEILGYQEADREATIEIAGQRVTAHDFVVSAWTYPESLRYRIIRARSDIGMELQPQVPEPVRILLAVAEAAGELVGAGAEPPMKDEISRMLDWYKTHFIPGLQSVTKMRDLRTG